MLARKNSEPRSEPEQGFPRRAVEDEGLDYWQRAEARREMREMLMQAGYVLTIAIGASLMVMGAFYAIFG